MAGGIVIDADTRVFRWSHPSTDLATTFRPDGKMRFVGEGWRRVGEPHREGPVRAARLFVSLHVGGALRWSPEDLVPIVTEVRTQQTQLPDPPFLVQPGYFTGRRDGAHWSEASVQVVVVHEPRITQADFRKAMVELAEVLCARLGHAEIVVQLQCDGLSKNTMGVAPVEGTEGQPGAAVCTVDGGVG